jgi:predicted ATP-dependent protease
MPTWLARPQASVPDPASDKWAPVIVGTLIRDKLDDLLMRANGGVLILPATDVLIADGAWPSLATSLATRGLSVKASWPPLPLTTRVALIGDGGAYNALTNAPGEFARLFRYEAWCNDAADWTPQAEATYAAFAAGVASRYALPVYDPSGAARLIAEGARRAGGLNRSRLSTDLLMLHDLAREAGRAAQARGAAATGGDDVDAALSRRRTLQGVNARRVREAILTGQEITPTSGAAIGQVNGLGIYEFHPPEGNFAVPTRISATVSAGRDERLLDIEHEADQADADHVRGEMTVEGYLAYRYGQGQPITLVARIRFEQEHGTTGGDSASGAILFSLLSALAELPIRFSYAVTGAVGQYGELQPIGGVNTKIEGFWELCRARRAQGERVEGGCGVIIPAVNARDLMLRADVADSIAREGWFHVWPVTTVDEAMTLLTGVPAAQLNARVDQRLRRFHALGGRPGVGR